MVVQVPYVHGVAATFERQHLDPALGENRVPEFHVGPDEGPPHQQGHAPHSLDGTAAGEKHVRA